MRLGLGLGGLGGWRRREKKTGWGGGKERGGADGGRGVEGVGGTVEEGKGGGMGVFLNKYIYVIRIDIYTRYVLV